PDWMASFIAGKIDYKPRLWLLARMPSFPARAEKLAQALSLEDGWLLSIAEEPPPDGGMVNVGRRLVGRNGEFICDRCHADGPPPAPPRCADSPPACGPLARIISTAIPSSPHTTVR